MEITCTELFAEMPKYFNAAMAEGLNKVIQFDLSGAGGGQWYAAIKSQKCEVKEGRHEKPDLTMLISAADYVDMTTGKLNGQQAFLLGRLRLAGDFGLAMKMQTLFQRPASVKEDTCTTQSEPESSITTPTDAEPSSE